MQIGGIVQAAGNAGAALIGGGIGIVYITTFAAYRLYELIPAPLTFALLVALGAAYALMALLCLVILMLYGLSTRIPRPALARVIPAC